VKEEDKARREATAPTFANCTCDGEEDGSRCPAHSDTATLAALPTPQIGPSE